MVFWVTIATCLWANWTNLNEELNCCPASQYLLMTSHYSLYCPRIATCMSFTVATVTMFCYKHLICQVLASFYKSQGGKFKKNSLSGLMGVCCPSLNFLHCNSNTVRIPFNPSGPCSRSEPFLLLNCNQLLLFEGFRVWHTEVKK